MIFSFGQLNFERGERTTLRASDIRFTSTNPPRVEAAITNTSLQSVGPLDVTAVVYGTDENALGVSKTIIDELGSEASKNIFFTWQQPFTVREEVCEIPTDTMLLIDRSGSMDDDGVNPPQPLTGVLSAAKKYIETIGDEARTGLITFATDASNPIDQLLTASSTEIIAKIDAVKIGSEGLQHTNAFSALEAAQQTFKSEVGNGRQKIAVLLTDGVVTRPRNPANPIDDIYPENQTIMSANVLKTWVCVFIPLVLGQQLTTIF